MKQVCFLLIPALWIVVCVSCNEPGSRPAPVATDSNATNTPPISMAGWTGSWRREEWQNNAGLDVDSVRGDKLYFRMTAVNGGHTGDVEGVAFMEGTTSAAFHETDEFDTCKIRFELLGDTAISVTQPSGQCGAGMGVSFAGIYRRDAGGKASSAPTENLLSLGVFSTTEEDDRFRALTGSSYDDFVTTTQLTSEDEEDLDGFGAKVESSGVRGLFTEMEHIIMTDGSNRIWAAVVNVDTVKYFTNSHSHRKVLPKTIERWRERFQQKVVSYESATKND